MWTLQQNLQQQLWEIVMEPPALKCNAIIPLPHSKIQNWYNFLAVNMIQIMEDITICRICAKVIIHLSPGQMHTSSLVLLFAVHAKQYYLDNHDILSSTLDSLVL